MAHYSTQPRAEDEKSASLGGDHEPTPTGLVTSKGEPIYRVPNAIGFHAEIT